MQHFAHPEKYLQVLRMNIFLSATDVPIVSSPFCNEKKKNFFLITGSQMLLGLADWPDLHQFVG
jgi:hypothetical protein